MRYFILMAVAAISLTSCVTKKKYDGLTIEKAVLQRENSELRRVADQKAVLDDSLIAIGSRLRAAQQLNTELKEVSNSQASLLQSANKKIDQLTYQNTELASVSASERNELSSQLLQKQRELETLESQLKSKEDDLIGLGESLAQREARLNAMTADIEAKNKRIEELTATLAAQDSVMKSLRNSVNNALRGFSAADLSIREENGRVYVSLSQNLLFPKGSSNIDPKGKDAIQKLATVLASSPDIQIMVEGHTDSDGSSDLNWDLSTNRATSVVKLMTANGVDPKRVTASGRGLYLPIAPNDNEANKSKNRRTEIILSPKLDQLYQLIK
jgi:chemotaxis protein MotB